MAYNVISCRKIAKRVGQSTTCREDLFCIANMCFVFFCGEQMNIRNTNHLSRAINYMEGGFVLHCQHVSFVVARMTVLHLVS